MAAEKCQIANKFLSYLLSPTLGSMASGGGFATGFMVESGRLRVRLLGIDTPETKKPGYTVGCWGPEATEFATTTLSGQRVALVTDPSQGLHDRYGRTFVFLDKVERMGLLDRGSTHRSRQIICLPRQSSQLLRRDRSRPTGCHLCTTRLWGPPCYGHTDSMPE